MPVNVETPIATSTANGVTTVFPYSFTVLQASDLVVTSTDSLGNVTTYTNGVHYSVSGVGTSAGSATFLVAPANGLIITRYRNSALSRSTDYQQNGDLLSDTLDNDFDRIWMALQEQQRSAAQFIRVPEAAGVPALPAAAARANTVLAFNSSGDPIATVPVSGSAADVLTQLADITVANKNAGLSGLNLALNYAARTIGASLVDRGIDLMNFVTTQAERAAIKAGTSVSDHSALFASAFILGKKIFVPAGTWRLLSTVTVPSGCTIEGAGSGATSISAYGCDAFRLAAGTSFVNFEKFSGFSFTAGGVADPRLYDAILSNGASGNLNNYVVTRDLYLQGFADSINWKYTWNSTVDNVTTINTNFGLQVFGQSVNNAVTKSRLLANGGTASIQTSQSGSDTPEGLMVSDTLLSSGNYGALGNGSFLSLHFANCVFDLIAIDAVHTTDCKDLRITNSWQYAANGCVRSMALGGAASQGASLIGNVLHVTSTAGAKVIEQQGANIGMSVIGNHIICGGTSVGVYLDGQAAVVEGNYHENTGSGADVVLNSSATTHRVGKGTRSDGAALKVTGGFGTPEYSEGTWTVTDQSGASLAIANTSQATYVKNGKQVTCTLDITFPATANGSAARLSLPFQPDAGSAWGGSIALQQTVTVSLQPNAGTGAANFVFWKPATQAFATNADLTGAHLIVSFTYRSLT